MTNRSYVVNGQIVIPRNGAEHVQLESAQRRRLGQPPLTRAEEHVIWAYRATGYSRPLLRRVK